MSEVTINIDDYLTEEEKKEIAKEEFRKRIELTSEKDIERIFSNALHHKVWSIYDDLESRGLTDNVRDKTKELIENLSAYSVFKSEDRWNPPNKNKLLLDKIVEEESELLRKSVRENLKRAYKDYQADRDMADMMSEAIYNLFSIRKEDLERESE